MTVDTRPCGSVVRAFQLAYGIANDGGAANDGLPRSLLIRSIFIRTSEGFLPHVPLWFQKLLFWGAAFIARITRIEKSVSKVLPIATAGQSAVLEGRISDRDPLSKNPPIEIPNNNNHRNEFSGELFP